MKLDLCLYLHLTNYRQKHFMTELFSNNSEYPKSVYEDAWEDMELLCENWIALHGVDRAFCKLAMNNFAKHLLVDL